MHETQPTPPEGFLVDGKGRWVPITIVKDVDLARHEFVLEMIERAHKINALLTAFKRDAMNDIQAFIDLSAEKYGVAAGGAKGNVTLVSFDGRFMVARAIAETLTFDERLQAAKALVDECIREWSAGSPNEIRALIEHAFQADSAGKVSTERILGLRRLDIDTAKWKEAMRAISDSVHVVSSKAYVRFYERVNGQWQPISLDLATIAEGAAASVPAPTTHAPKAVGA